MFTVKGLVFLRFVVTSSEMERADGGVSSGVGADAAHGMDSSGVMTVVVSLPMGWMVVGSDLLCRHAVIGGVAVVVNGWLKCGCRNSRGVQCRLAVHLL